MSMVPAPCARPPYAVRAVLFDLDGTLADTAPDLGGALNRLRAQAGLPPLPLAVLAPLASSGARGMLAGGLDKHPGDADYESLRLAFLAEYAGALTRDSRLFDGVPALLEALQARGLAWGIVTNKHLVYAQPVVQGLGLGATGVLVGGDSTPHPKPHPAPLQAACAALGVAPADCVYVGDDERDIQAARAAGMPGIAAAYGYLGQGRPLADWGADACIDQPLDLLDLLDRPASAA